MNAAANAAPVADLPCPICGRRINWSATPPYRLNAVEQPELLVRDPGEVENSWQERLTRAYRPCGDVSQPGTHLLPYHYADYTPVTIGVIGQSSAGKTHLLAAMIHRLCSGDPVLVDQLGLRVSELDVRVHRRYLAQNVTPLITQRRELGATRADVPVDFCDALKVTNRRNQTFAVVFFDLAGERLERPNDDEARFYAWANALIFVVNAATLPKRFGRRIAPVAGDASFEVALHRLSGRGKPTGVAPLHPVAAAVVVAKADLIEFDDRLVATWMRAGSAEEEAALGTVEAESEDVYVYLTRRGAAQWLKPARDCYRSTLHFASATNSQAELPPGQAGDPAGPAQPAGQVQSENRVFPRTFRQRRVLKPLLSVFEMTGILDESDLLPAKEPQ